MAKVKKLTKGWWFGDDHNTNIQVVEVTDKYLTVQSSGPIWGSWIEWLDEKGWVLHSSPSNYRVVYEGWNNAKLTVFKRVPKVVLPEPGKPIYHGEKFEVSRGIIEVADVDGLFVTIKTRVVPHAEVYRFMHGLRKGYRVIAGPTRSTNAGVDIYYTTFQEI